MIAFTLIPGCCGVFAGRTLELKRRPLARDLGAYILSLLWLYMCFEDGTWLDPTPPPHHPYPYA